MAYSEPECLEHPSGGCQGAVELRDALSPTGVPFLRCDAHWTAAVERQREIEQRYPEHAPPDFDPTFAGEVWDPED